MEIYQLEHFKKLCETGSFSKTATYFHVTQPAVSISIKKLEAEFGGDLIERNNKSFTITPMGEALLAHASKVLSAVSALYADMQEYGIGAHNTIRIGLPLTMYGAIAMAITEIFMPQHPEIPIHITHSSPEYVSEAINTNTLDLCVTFSLLADNMNKKTFGQVEFGAYVSDTHPLSQYTQLTPDLFDGASFLFSDKPFGISKCFHAYFKKYSIKADYLKSGNLLPIDAYNRAIEGDGIAILDKNFAHSKCISLNPPLIIDTVIGWSKERPLTKDQQLLIKFIKDLSI